MKNLEAHLFSLSAVFSHLETFSIPSIFWSKTIKIRGCFALYVLYLLCSYFFTLTQKMAQIILPWEYLNAHTVFPQTGWVLFLSCHGSAELPMHWGGAIPLDLPWELSSELSTAPAPSSAQHILSPILLSPCSLQHQQLIPSPCQAFPIPSKGDNNAVPCLRINILKWVEVKGLHGSI